MLVLIIVGGFVIMAILKQERSQMPAVCPYCSFGIYRVLKKPKSKDMCFLKIVDSQTKKQHLFFLRITVFFGTKSKKTWLARINQCPFCYRKLGG